MCVYYVIKKEETHRSMIDVNVNGRPREGEREEGRRMLAKVTLVSS